MENLPLNERTTAELQELFEVLRKRAGEVEPLTDEWQKLAAMQQEVAKILDERLGNK